MDDYSRAGPLHLTRARGRIAPNVSPSSALILLIMLAFALACPFLMSAAQAGEWHELSEPDQSNWSKKRTSNYQTYTISETPIAVLEVPARNIAVAVYPDNIPHSLEAGVSWVTSTSAPGAGGNVAIAGHRDGFFRNLEGIPAGTSILLRDEEQVRHFVVDTVTIVDPLDLSPLDQTDDDVLTLITCYPFYYQGFAPDRYIIRAIRADDS